MVKRKQENVTYTVIRLIYGGDEIVGYYSTLERAKQKLKEDARDRLHGWFSKSKEKYCIITSLDSKDIKCSCVKNGIDIDWD